MMQWDLVCDNCYDGLSDHVKEMSDKMKIFMPLIKVELPLICCICEQEVRGGRWIYLQALEHRNH